jgi:hypothetical protein
MQWVCDKLSVRNISPLNYPENVLYEQKEKLSLMLQTRAMEVNGLGAALNLNNE